MIKRKLMRSYLATQLGDKLAKKMRKIRALCVGSSPKRVAHEHAYHEITSKKQEVERSEKKLRRMAPQDKAMTHLPWQRPSIYGEYIKGF